MGSRRILVCTLWITALVLLSGAQLALAEEEQGDDESAQEAATNDAETDEAETNDAQEDGEAEEATGGQMGRRVIHMGPRDVNGQFVRAGAIQLVRRTPRQLHELVSLRTTFRDRIVNQVYRSSEQR